MTYSDDPSHSNNVLRRLKVSLGIKTDLQLAEYFDIKPTTISSWKSRNTLDYQKIIEKCENVNLNWLFKGEDFAKNQMVLNKNRENSKTVVYNMRKKEVRMLSKELRKLGVDFEENYSSVNVAIDTIKTYQKDIEQLETQISLLKDLISTSMKK